MPERSAPIPRHLDKVLRKSDFFKDDWIPDVGETKKICFQITCNSGAPFYGFYASDFRVKNYNKNDPIW